MNLIVKHYTHPSMPWDDHKPVNSFYLKAGCDPSQIKDCLDKVEWFNYLEGEKREKEFLYCHVRIASILKSIKSGCLYISYYNKDGGDTDLDLCDFYSTHNCPDGLQLVDRFYLSNSNLYYWWLPSLDIWIACYKGKKVK